MTTKTYSTQHLIFAAFISLLFFTGTAIAQNLKINEVVTKSNKTLKSVDGSYPDWIEIYNEADSSIDLTGYSLSDNRNSPTKWTFTNGLIEPNSHLTIFASGNSKTELATISQTQEDINNIGWDYADKNDEQSPGTSSINYTHFNNTAFGKINGKPAVAAEIYYGTPGDLGYSYAGVHVKFKDWEVSIDRSAYETLKIRMYLEEGKKLNLLFAQTGLEDWQNHAFPIIGTGDTTWYEFSITENVDPLDLSILTGLTITPPNNVYDQSYNFVLLNIVFETQLIDRFHTNFKLSSEGESVYLSNPQGIIIDTVQVPPLIEDVSYGRQSDGNNNWVIFNKTTPDTPNGGTITNGVCNAELQFNLEAGFYNGSQTVAITGSSEIRYTIDGSAPTANSHLYNGEITIDSSTVIRAACFDSGKTPKYIFTSTYFINYETTLPVWSISTHPDNFFSEDSGIYVLGPEGNWEIEAPYFGANFWQDWERPVHVEFFEEDGKKELDFDCGIKVFGNYSRANPKKSLSLHFRGKYDMSKLEYPIFPDYPGLSSFDDLLLRGSGGDESYLHFRDGFHAELAKNLDFEKQKYRPSVLFINGVYWGIHNIREKSNEDYFVDNYNIDKEDIDLITSYFIERNGPTSLDFVDFINDLRNDSYTLSQIKEIIDVNSFIDYFAYEVYISNYDWAANNSKYWRQSSTRGKWRWFMFDTDYSTAIYSLPETQADYNAINKALDYTQFDIGWPSSEQSTLLPRKLFEFPEFKQTFINRYCDLMNTLFLPENIFSVMQEKVLNKISNEVPVNRERWNLSKEDWFTYLDQYKDFWNKRAYYARLNMKNQFSLDDSVTLHLTISPANAGYIKLNTIEIDDENWSGLYFKGIPVTLEAIANPGFTFTGWESNNIALDNTDLALISNINLTIENTFTANFDGEAIEQLFTLSEINYNSPANQNTQDWVELHNYGTADINISGWIIKDEKLYNSYKIPNNTILASGNYLIIAEDVSAFKSVHTSIPTLGPLGFSLSNSGEHIYIYNERGQLQQSIRYNDKAPWDTFADGEGGTLELILAGSDINEATNWASPCFGGSPQMGYDISCPSLTAVSTSFDSDVKYTLSPNPSNEYISLDAELTSIANELMLYSLDGRLIKNLKASDRIDISFLDAGMYLLKVSTTTINFVTFKFIKE